MRTFKSSELRTFEQILQLRQEPLRKVLVNFLKKHYSKVDATKDYITAEGDIPIALVAHMDTVFKDPPVEIFFDPRHNAMISPDGLGADDRAGVFAIIQIIRSGLRPHVIFTTDEEMGGIGASVLSSQDCPFKDLRYLIELDRRGAQDCVFYDCDNEKFVDYVESFGFTWNWGTFSDISFLCPNWKIAGVNLSVGYQHEHTFTEILYVGHLLSTIEKVKKMLTAEDIPSFEYIPKKYNKFDDINSDYGYNFGEIIKCGRCGTYHMEEEMFPVLMQDLTTKFYCPECLSAVDWCVSCDSAYEPSINDKEFLCPLCTKDMKEGKK